MFMEIAIGAIGIGIVLMVGYLVISQVRSALPTAALVQVHNPCLGIVGVGSTVCENTTTAGTWTAPTICGTANLSGTNATSFISCTNVGYATGTTAVQATVFAGFGLIAVGIIVLAAFGLINVFRG